jgi:hypothetical protein
MSKLLSAPKASDRPVAPSPRNPESPAPVQDEQSAPRCLPFLRRWFSWATPRVRVTIEVIALVLALGGAGIWFYAPYFVRDYINHAFQGLPEYTGRVEQVRIHPITASIDIYDFHIDKKGVPVPYFRSPRWNVALQWRQIIHGVFRAKVSIYQPRLNIVNGPSSGQSQSGISGVWIDVIRALIPWRINQLFIYDGDAHFLDFHADPQVDLECSHINFSADNISNAEHLNTPLPATVRLTANPLQTGYVQMDMKVNLDEKYATFEQTFKMEHVPAVAANSALQNYLKVRVKSGDIGLYSQVVGDKGAYHGYAKPFFDHLEFEPKPSDKGTLGAAWSGVLNTVKSVFEDDQHVIATDAPISGRIDEPTVDGWKAFMGVLWNAYIESLKPGFDRNQAPAPPSDTVTTPKSDQTQNESQAPSPAAKPTLDQAKAKAAEQK